MVPRSIKPPSVHSVPTCTLPEWSPSLRRRHFLLDLIVDPDCRINDARLAVEIVFVRNRFFPPVKLVLFLDEFFRVVDVGAVVASALEAARQDNQSAPVVWNQ